MIEKITFQDTDEKVFVTIDNETQDFEIKKIKKLPTYIDLDQSLNTALENNIELRASIYYIEEKEETETIEYIMENTDRNDVNPKINIDGTVTVTIYNDDDIYYSQNKKFVKGNIVDSIPNRLPLGSYRMVIEYAGNKYFEASTLDIQFEIEKRLAICRFKKERYYGDYTETVNIEGVIKDSEKNIPITSSLKYDFDGETYTIETDSNGNFIMPITIPHPDVSHCQSFREDIIEETIFEPGDLYEEQYEEEFIDEDGNIRLYSSIEEINTLYDSDSDTASPINIEEEDDESNIISITDGSEQTIENIEEDIITEEGTSENYFNMSYIVNIYTDNDSYYLGTTQIEIIANKAHTSVTIDSTNADTISNILTIHGSVIATYNNTDNDVRYGTVNILLPDFNYTHTLINIGKDNAFETQIDLAQVYGVSDNNNTEEIEPYDTTSIITTSIKLTGDTNVNVGEMFTIEGKIVSAATDEYIKDGILIFMLFDNDDNLLYQYATELDSMGIGTFHFNTSRKITYKIQAKYIGIFGYKDSESEKIEVKVK